MAMGAVKVVSLLSMRLLPPCGFHVVTGHPCPTCGSTRVILYLLDGHWAQAFQVNPFFFVCLAALTFWAVAGAVAWLMHRDLSVHVSRREERWLWVLLGAAFLVNWAYLWIAGI